MISVKIVKISFANKTRDQTGICKYGANKLQNYRFTSIIDQKFIFEMHRVALEVGMNIFRNARDKRVATLTFRICLFQVSLLSRMNPRYLVWLVHGMMTLLTEIRLG